MKDPAFLFYSNDFLTGVLDLTFEERGQYITLLALQHQKGHLTTKAISVSVPGVSQDVLDKFSIDEEGNYYNERLEVEANKRAEHSRKQKERALKGWNKRKQSGGNAVADAVALPLEDENVNENRDIDIIKKVVQYLNDKLSTNYRHNSRATAAPIQARLNEGYKLEDFKKVIDTKSEEWQHNADFSKFLRPATLFSPKFEGYLNQVSATPSREEEFDLEILKHMQNVQSEIHNNGSTDGNRLRGIS